jgi:hypothetical protein
MTRRASWTCCRSTLWAGWCRRPWLQMGAAAQAAGGGGEEAREGGGRPARHSEVQTRGPGWLHEGTGGSCSPLPLRPSS